MELTGGLGCDAWIENVSPEQGDIGIQCLGYAGQFVSICAFTVSGELKANNPKSISIHFINLGKCYNSGNPNPILEIKLMSDEFIQLYGEGKIKSCLKHKIKFEEIKEYLLKLRERHV
mmetsp:Transcript_40930/g.36296  ORF Transcript_40930/g.36296 Transcript_40930/m.36296 type:complete len:118 (-) Transcript_40930:51-404(-)